MISESPMHSIAFAPISIAFLSPWTNASYSAMLLVHSNSNLHAIMVLIPLGSISTHLTPDPSFDLEPSKNKVQIIGSILKLVLTLYTLWTTLLENGTYVRWVTWECFYSFSIGDTSVGKSPKKVSNVKHSIWLLKKEIDSLEPSRSVTVCFMKGSLSNLNLLGCPLRGNHRWDQSIEK